MKSIPVILAAIFLSISCYAQNEAGVWYFGNRAGIDFNGSAPKALTNGALSTKEGCATISDQNGNLLFYTDGMKVWTRNHQVMPNGFGLHGDSSSTQSAIIVPMPGTNDSYYIFTLDEHLGNKGFCYSIVDMSLNSGLGDITLKNIHIFSYISEKITAVKHVNDVDYWVIIHEWGNNTFVAYLVSPSGISNPVRSNTGISHNGITNNKIGYLQSSPDGSRLVSAIKRFSLIEIFDFDNSTGIVSNPISIQSSKYDLVYGVSFSPDGSRLYAGTRSHPYSIFQFDMTAGSDSDIINSSTLIATSDSEVGALQIGPDGKIYCSIRYHDYIGIIDNPNDLGPDVKFNENGLYLEGRKCVLGLPTFIQSFFDTEISISSNGPICEGDTLFLDAEDIHNGTYSWTGPNGFQSSDREPVISNATPDMSGTYFLEVQIPGNTGRLRAEIEIVVHPKPKCSIECSTTQPCEGESLVLSTNHINPDWKYSWSNGESGTETSIFESGLYTLVVESEFGCIDSATLFIEFNPAPDASINSDRNTLCIGDSLILEAKPSDEECSYQWSTGETTQSIVVWEPGTYSLIVTNTFGCSAESPEYVIGLDSNRVEISSSMGSSCIDLGEVNYRQLSCLNIGLNNQYDNTILIDSISFIRNIEYSIPQSQLPLLLGPYEYSELEICFSPVHNSSHRDTLVFFDYCSVRKIPISADVLGFHTFSTTRCGTLVRLTIGGREIEGPVIISGGPVPNPASEKAVIDYSVNSTTYLNVALYNSYGAFVSNIYTGIRKAGDYRAVIDTHGLVDGAYYCVFTTGENTIMRQFIKCD